LRRVKDKGGLVEWSRIAAGFAMVFGSLGALNGGIV